MEAVLNVTKCPFDPLLNLYGDYSHIARIGIRENYEDANGVILYLLIGGDGKAVVQITEDRAKELAWAKLFSSEDSTRATQPKIPNEKDQSNQESNPVHRQEVQGDENHDAEEHGQAS